MITNIMWWKDKDINIHLKNCLYCMTLFLISIGNLVRVLRPPPKGRRALLSIVSLLFWSPQKAMHAVHGFKESLIDFL